MSWSEMTLAVTGASCSSFSERVAVTVTLSSSTASTAGAASAAPEAANAPWAKRRAVAEAAAKHTSLERDIEDPRVWYEDANGSHLVGVELRPSDGSVKLNEIDS